MNTRLIIVFLIGAAVAGFLLDFRRKALQSRKLNIDRSTGIIPPTGETAPEVVG
jgi:hypothetical protein